MLVLLWSAINTSTYVVLAGLLLTIVIHNTDGAYYYQNKAIKDSLGLTDIGVSWPAIDSC